MRGRRLAAILAAGLLALAGCGGGDDLAPQVPGAPANVTVPESDQSPADTAASAQNKSSSSTSSSSSDSSSSDSTSSSGTGTSSGSTGTGTSGTPTPSAGGGTAAPDTQADSPSNDTAPPAGSDAQQFEDFCAQNPGAC